MIIVEMNVLFYTSLGLGSLRFFQINQFGFKGTEESFDYTIAVAISFP